ncbi:ABC transporter permease [Rhizobium sp. CAU 1783]
MAEVTSAPPMLSPVLSGSRAFPFGLSLAARWPSALILTTYLLFVAIPIVAVILYSIATRWTTSILPDGYTLAHWLEAARDPRFVAVLLRTFLLAVAVAVFTVALVTPAVYWQHVRNPRIRTVLSLLAGIPFSLPYVVIGFGLLKVTGEFAPWLQGTAGLLLVAQVSVAFSFAYWSIDASMTATNVVALTETARTCGAGLFQTLRHVILPNVRAGIVSGAILAFGVSFGELALVQILVGSRFETLELYMLNMLKSADANFNILAVITMISFVITLVLTAAVAYVSRDGGRAVSRGVSTDRKTGR